MLHYAKLSLLAPANSMALRWPGGTGGGRGGNARCTISRLAVPVPGRRRHFSLAVSHRKFVDLRPLSVAQSSGWLLQGTKRVDSSPSSHPLPWPRPQAPPTCHRPRPRSRPPGLQSGRPRSPREGKRRINNRFLRCWSTRGYLLASND